MMKPIEWPESYFKQRIKEWVSNEHSLYWNNLDSCRQSKYFIKNPGNKISKVALNLSKQKLHLLVGILTGHSTLNGHLHRMRLTDSSICNACQEEEETAIHFTCYCPSQSQLRNRVFGKYFLTLDEYKEVDVLDISSFISKSKRFE